MIGPLRAKQVSETLHPEAQIRTLELSNPDHANEDQRNRVMPFSKHSRFEMSDFKSTADCHTQVLEFADLNQGKSHS